MTNTTPADARRDSQQSMPVTCAILAGKGPILLTSLCAAGQELYMIPGIDMLNHSTRPENVNTTLQRRDETVSKQGDNNKDRVDFTGFFAIEAGEPLALS